MQQHVVERRPQRREADAAGDEHDVVAVACSTGQAVPKGPRTPDPVALAASFCSARVVAPTARIVCTSSSGCAGSPLIEIGTSPTPKT